MADPDDATISPLGSGALAKGPTVTEPRAADASGRQALTPTHAASSAAAAVPLFWTPDRSATAAPSTIWTQYKIRVLTPEGVPLKQERCVLLAGTNKFEKRTDDLGSATFVVATVDGGQAAHLAADSVGAGDVPMLLLPDILEEFVESPPTSDAFAPKRDLDRQFRYRLGDGTIHPAVTLSSGELEVRIGALTEQQKFEHFRWSYVSNSARYASGAPGDYGKDSPRWERTIGASCNQHVNLFLGYWFNYNAAFTASGGGTDAAYLPTLDAGNGFFKYKNEKPNHRGYAPFVEAVTDFHAATYLTDFQDKVFPGRERILSLLLDADGKTHRPERMVRPEQYAHYIRLSRCFDYGTPPTLNAEGRRFIDALADFNVYSVSEYTEATERNGGLDSTRSWVRKNRALPQLQAYTIARGKTSVPLAQATDAELAALPNERLWEIVWKLDDDHPEDAALLSTLRGHMNVDHHAGLLVKRAVGGGPLTGAGPVELWKFSADGTKDSPQPIVMKPFTKVLAGSTGRSDFTHYAVWKLKPLRDGGLAPNDMATRAAVAGKISLDEPPRFIRWR